MCGIEVPYNYILFAQIYLIFKTGVAIGTPLWASGKSEYGHIYTFRRLAFAYMNIVAIEFLYHVRTCEKRLVPLVRSLATTRKRAIGPGQRYQLLLQPVPLTIGTGCNSSWYLWPWTNLVEDNWHRVVVSTGSNASA